MASLAPHIDHLVAVDGAYGLYPGAEPRSSSDQAHAVTGACSGAGIGLTLHQPQTPWFGNETEKRTAMFALAHAVAVPDEDWLLVIDADEVVSRAAGLREGLIETDLNVCELLLEDDDGVSPARRLFRARRGGIRVVGRHFHYLDANDHMLWGDHNQVLAEQLWGVRVTHRTTERPGRRHERRREYYRRRDELGVEHVAAS